MISIIIPVYNTEKFLARCLNSIITQFTQENGEVILVNDGSTDNSEVICQEFSEKYPFIKYFKKENGGLSSARNFGLDRATQEYVFFVDSDDWLDEKCIETVSFHLKTEQNLDILIFGAFKVFGNDKVLLNIEDFETNQPLEAFYFTLANNGADVYACNKIFRRTLFKKQRFPEGKIYEDMYLIPRLFLKANTFKFIRYYGYAYFMNQGSITFGNINHKQFSNVWHRLGLLKLIDNNKNIPSELKWEIHRSILNGFISTGAKTIHSHNNSRYFYSRLKRIIKIYFKKYKGESIKSTYFQQLLAIALLYVNPNLFLWLYKKYKN